MHYVLYVATPSNLPLDRSPLDSRKISTNYDSTNRVRRITNKTLVNPRLFFSLSLFLFLSVSSVQRYAKWTVVARDVCVIRYIFFDIKLAEIFGRIPGLAFSCICKSLAKGDFCMV